AAGTDAIAEQHHGQVLARVAPEAGSGKSQVTKAGRREHIACGRSDRRLAIEAPAHAPAGPFGEEQIDGSWRQQRRAASGAVQHGACKRRDVANAPKGAGVSRTAFAVESER